MGNVTNITELKMALIALSDEDLMNILTGNPKLEVALGKRICAECMAARGECPHEDFEDPSACADFEQNRWIHRRNMGGLDSVFKEALA